MLSVSHKNIDDDIIIVNKSGKDEEGNTDNMKRGGLEGAGVGTRKRSRSTTTTTSATCSSPTNRRSLKKVSFEESFSSSSSEEEEGNDLSATSLYKKIDIKFLPQKHYRVELPIDSIVQS
mmetsp:Transcript_25094/g.37511  ORF Transcript_25094/g.37511 Transcript_25094/m.37511 type:complete len:120 (-) Transcript_25094:3622-3981(-)